MQCSVQSSRDAELIRRQGVTIEVSETILTNPPHFQPTPRRKQNKQVRGEHGPVRACRTARCQVHSPRMIQLTHFKQRLGRVKPRTVARFIVSNRKERQTPETRATTSLPETARTVVLVWLWEPFRLCAWCIRVLYTQIVQDEFESGHPSGLCCRGRSQPMEL